VAFRATKPGGARWPAALCAVAAAASLPLASCGRSQPAGSGPPTSAVQDGRTSGQVVVKLAYVAQFRAKVLVDAAGYSLYIFGPDHRRSVTCTATCALSWPPLTVPPGTKPMTGPGVAAGLAGVLPGPGGSDVVTYNGWPLYTYVADVSPGVVSGEGINLNGGPWYLMKPDGAPLVPAGQPQPLRGSSP